MNAGPLVALGAVLLLALKKRQAPGYAPMTPTPQAPPEQDAGGIVVTPGTLYLKPLNSDTAVGLAATITGDPSRWKELRDEQPSRRRRDQISKGMMSPSWWLQLPASWVDVDAIPSERLAEFEQAVSEDPLIASQEA